VASRRPRSSTKTLNFSLPQQKIIRNQALPSKQNSDQNSKIEFVTPDVGSVDSSTDVPAQDSTVSITGTVLESITRPSLVNNNVDILDETVATQVDSIFINLEVSPKDAEVSDIRSGEVSKLSTASLNLVDPTRNEDVKAILEASGRAAAMAEASIPPELIEQLDFVKTNATATLSTLPDILTAASVVGEPTAITKINPPKVSKILKFAIPAIGVWLCNPLLSLIDTSAVGLFSGTIQQAALSPAVAVTDYAALLIAFMYTGATNLVAAAQEADRGTPKKPKTTKVLIGSMQLSTYVGAALGTVLFLCARPLLKAIIGNDGISPSVFAAAMRYVRIRALGMPAAAIIGSTQAACLGMQDIRSPLYVLVAAAVVNFFGDVIFVRNSHPLIGGAAGAAWATVISQYVGVFLFLKWLTHKSNTNPRVVNISNAILEMTGKPSSKGKSRREKLRDTLEGFALNFKPRKPSNKLITKLWSRPKKSTHKKATLPEDNFTVRGFLSDRFSFRDLLKFPSTETRKDFAAYLAPVTATQVGRVSGYIAMSHVVSSSLGTASMAAQQVIVSLFYCLCPIADSLSLTAQSFLPSISQKAPSPERSAALRKTALNFIKAGAIFGGAMVGAVAAIPLISSMFTSDAAVIALVNSVVPLLLGFFSVHGMLCASEGVLLGQKDLNFLGRMYGMYFAALPYLMLQVKKAALTGSRVVDLTSVWKVFLGYQIFRFVAWVSRVAVLQKKTEQQCPILEHVTP